MWLKDNKKTESDELYWTKKYQKQQEISNKKSGNSRPNNYNEAILIFISTLLLMFSIYAINKNSKLSFLIKSKVASAIIVEYKYNNTLVNQMDKSRIENYYYRYCYLVNGEKIYSSDLLDEYRYNNCISKDYKKGDTILIRYLKNNPTKSKIKCNNN